MRKVLLALTATFAVCLAVFAGTTMCVKKQNGDILRINVDDVYEVYFEDIFNPDTSSIIPPFIEPSVKDTSAYAPLRFRITSDSTVELTYGNYRDLDSVNIPAKVKIDGKVYSVTKIGDYALCPKYSDCYGLISVAIPSSVTSIGYDAFSGCSSLTTIEIPSSVTSIGSYAFAWCENLDVVIDNSRKNIEIRMNAFIDCHSLTFKKDPIMDSSVDDALISSFDYEILADSTAKIIEYHYYDYDNKIDSMTMPSKVVIDNNIYNVSSIGGHTFLEIEAPSHIIIPEGITSIVDYAFLSVSNLKSVSLPSSVTSIGSSAFYNCSSLESINVDAKNPNYSSLDGILYNKDKTEIIAVPQGIKGSISIPESVTSIGSEAFRYCSSLTSIEIPSSVTEIGEYAFEGCSSLESINVDAKNPNYSSLDGIVYNKEKTEIIAVPYGIKGSISIPEGVTSIDDIAFSFCSRLTSIEIPSSVTSIGSSAFWGCSRLTSIEIPSSVTSIGFSAFRYCSSMTSVEIPSSVTSIGSNAFRDCKNLDVVIDNSEENVKVEGDSFYGVKSVKWLKKVADVSVYAPLRFEITSDSTVELTRGENWNSYRNLDSVNIPAKVKIEGKVYSVTSIGWDAFESCSSLTSIAIPSSVTSIGDDAFRVCSSLTSITIPESVTEIGSSAFFSCSSLTSITIPESVTEIGEYAFGYCSSVTSIEIPSSVTSIGRGAFSGYDKLDPEVLIYDYGTKCFGCIGDSSKCVEVVIPEGVISIDNSAFEGYYNLTSITIPESVTSIGSSAFSGCSSLESINVDVKNSIYSSLDGIIYNKEKTEIIYVPRGIKGSIHIPEGVTEIGEYAFYYCSSLESINVDAKNPNYSSLDGIVYNKEKTEIIAVPKGIKGSISIPSSVTSISYSAFYDCDSLTSIEIPSSVTSIGERAFAGCGSLTSIEIPSSVTSIGEYAFCNCENLDVVIDNSEENVKVGYRAFGDVKSVNWLK